VLYRNARRGDSRKTLNPVTTRKGRKDQQRWRNRPPWINKAVLTASLFMLMAPATVFAFRADPQAYLVARAAIGEARTCSARQLAAAAHWGGATEALVGEVTLKNRSNSECRLHGYPYVQILERHLRVVPTVLRRGPRDTQTAAPKLPPLDRERGIVRPGHVAYFYTNWGEWCGGRIARPAYLRVRLPGNAGTVRVRVNDTLGAQGWLTAPPCEIRGPSWLVVGPFQLLR
jgi:Protein of unknown function (DUF4232)